VSSSRSTTAQAQRDQPLVTDLDPRERFSDGSELLAQAAVLKQASPRFEEHSPSRRGYRLRRLLVVSDLVALTAAFGAMVAANAVAGRQNFFDSSVIPVFVALIPAWITLAGLVGLYHLSERRVDESFADEIGPVATVTTVWSWLLLVASSALTKAPIELLGPIVAWATAIVLVLTLRAVARRIARGSAWFRQPVLLIGSDEDIDRVLNRIHRHPELGLDPLASVCIWPDSHALIPLASSNGSAPTIRRLPGRPHPGDLRAVIEEVGISRVIVTGWSESIAERTELMRVLSESGVCIDYVSGEPEALYSTAVLHHIEGLPILTIRPTATRVTRSLKRGIDVTASAIGLALLSPLLAFVAVRIRMDSPGPILFRQPRAGLDGTEFELLKFRTMVEGADQMRDELRAGDDRIAAMKMLKLREDPRVTGFGGALRRWSVDELPQLWNVFRGDMSLVGPRPLPLDETLFVDGHFAERLRMRPGITGPWQINGRSDIPFEDMIKLDYMYVASWTMREDLRLLVRTVGAVLHGRGAY
jgi:exopolysaccharide biosynthesis polyprenyl glycosylphosphotransferase